MSPGKKRTPTQFKIGDKVKVTGIAESYTSEWRNTWVPEMNKSVGKIMVISDIHKTAGIRLESIPRKGPTYRFPPSVLKKVKSSDEKIKRVSEKFERLISGLQNNGCKRVANEVYKMYARFKKSHKFSIDDVEYLNAIWKAYIKK